jgi:ATP-dependent Clp protease adapter protein ClpS
MAKFFQMMPIDYYKDFLNDHFTKVTIFAEVTTFTDVITFTDFIEAFLNKFFRFTRDIARA